jgi:nitrogen fixation/metabolism regulation signal transduction histidine kinase
MKNSGNILLSRYGLILALLITALAGISLLLGWLAFGLHTWITFFNVLVLWIVVASLIFYHAGKIKRDVSRFFDVLQSQDTVQRFNTEKSDRYFKNLYTRMNQVIQTLSDIKSEKEKDNLFFRAVIDHAETGLVVHDESGRIMLINKAAQDLLGPGSPGNVSETPIAESLTPGRKNILKIERNSEIIQLSLRNTMIRTDSGNLTLLSLQNIRQELEQHEVEAWQKLIRIFIHEIMNSVGPITLTSSAIIGILENESHNHPNNSEIIEGLKAIRNRSKGIAAFMEAYRRLSHTPVPDFNDVPAERLLSGVAGIMSADLQNKGITLSVHIVPKDIMIRCDEKLIEQVLINLIRNSADALQDILSPEIRLSCVMLLGRIEIQVHDNGQGIDPNILESIFVPFFSTKEEGTGIGLSLSRQIMNLHGGSIFVNSAKGNTVFTLNFPDL